VRQVTQIGTEEETVVVEPLEDPVPQEEPAPTPERAPVPEKTPELVPA
jgi:hypothetical protein